MGKLSQIKGSFVTTNMGINERPDHRILCSGCPSGTMECLHINSRMDVKCDFYDGYYFDDTRTGENAVKVFCRHIDDKKKAASLVPIAETKKQAHRYILSLDPMMLEDIINSLDGKIGLKPLADEIKRQKKVQEEI